MHLVVNIGNSNIRLGFFQDEVFIQSWVINTHPIRSKDEYRVTLSSLYLENKVALNKIESITIGSVVPTLTPILVSTLKRIHGIVPVVVTRDTPSGVKHSSSQMGTDLYANAVAAHNLYQGKKLVIDFGTALTFTGIDGNGLLLGVVIAPGVITSLKALVGDTAQLPDIELIKPQHVLGKNTETCMQSGMVYGFLGMVEGIIERTLQEYQEPFTVIATGGMGHIFAPLSDKIDSFDRLHTLRGLLMLATKNSE